MAKRTVGQSDQISSVIGAARRDTMTAKRPFWAKNPISARLLKSYEGSAVVIALVAILAWFTFSGGPARAQNVPRGETIFQRCAACHSVTRGKANGVGPNLHGIVGQPVASRPKFAYSKALSAAGGVWSRDRLDAFLKNPSKSVPGTRMTAGAVPSDQDRRDLIAFLVGTARH